MCFTLKFVLFGLYFFVEFMSESSTSGGLVLQDVQLAKRNLCSPLENSMPHNFLLQWKQMFETEKHEAQNKTLGKCFKQRHILLYYY